MGDNGSPTEEVQGARWDKFRIDDIAGLSALLNKHKLVAGGEVRA